MSALVSPNLAGRTILLGVGGGIAAYKAAELVRLLRKAEAAVHVIMTAAAQQFITPLTLQSLSGNPVATELFDLARETEGSGIGHIDLADRADLLVVCPATADLLARLAHGHADDLLTTVALACQAPLLVCPAMNVNMWAHPAVQDNLQRLITRGASVCGPESGELACGWVGAGRLSDPAAILAAIAARLSAIPGPLAGRRVLVSAGPTYEPLDPVRFLGNRSSGKMGFALARAAAARGAEVTLVAGPVSLPTPPGVRRVDVTTAAEMAAAVLPAAAAQDLIIMAAAVADYRPVEAAGDKLKKDALGGAPSIALTPTTDILATLGAQRRSGAPVLVGFAAETTAVLAHAERKLRRKGCDLLVVNDVTEPGAGFSVDTNRVALLSLVPDGDGDRLQVDALPLMSKDAVAEAILDRAAARLVVGKDT